MNWDCIMQSKRNFLPTSHTLILLLGFRETNPSFLLKPTEIWVDPGKAKREDPTRRVPLWVHQGIRLQKLADKPSSRQTQSFQ